MTVQFTDASSGSPTGWAWFFGDETYTQSWTLENASSGWSGRDSQAVVTMPDGSIVLMGGIDTTGITTFNDTWRSTDNGKTWTLENASSGWSGRQGHTAVAMPDGSIVLMGGGDENGTLLFNDTWRSTDNGATWMQVSAGSGWEKRFFHSSAVMPDGSIVLMGGDDNSKTLNDTWRSTDNGKTWVQVNAGSGWEKRFFHSSVVMPDGSIVLMGGDNSDNTALNDTWRSTDNGATWIQVNANSGWSARAFHSSVVIPDGSIVLMGGGDWEGNRFFNDTWRSTDNGATWMQVNASSGWSGRWSHSSVAMPDGSIVLTGGTNDYYTSAINDMWRSTDNGATWMQVNAGSRWSQRACHSSVAMPDGSIVLMGGYDGTTSLNDTWRLQPAGSSLKNPSHIYTTAGTYSVALQAFNAGGYDSTQKRGYIAVSGSETPVANFAGTPVSGTAPLTVQFTDASSGNPTGWAWFFGDETFTQSWTQKNASSGWSGRDSQAVVTMPDGSIVLMGGTDATGSTLFNDTWRSTDNGATWSRVNASSGWSGRQGHTAVAMPDGSIVLMGGGDGNGTLLFNDTWRSTDNGATWTQVNAGSGWGKRYFHSSVVMPDGSIVLMGGDDGGKTLLNDTWRSTDNGATWTQVNANSGWSGRACHSSVTMPGR